MTECRVGGARVRLTPEIPGGTVGWGPLGRTDAVPPDEPVDQMYATAIALEDPQGRRVVMVNADLMGASAKILDNVATSTGLDRAELIMCGTHTHAGPAIQFGALMYTLFGNATLKGVRASSRRLTSLLAHVVREALRDLRPGGVAVERGVVLDASSNRAYPAMRHLSQGERDEYVSAGPGAGAPDDAPVADRSCDRRVTVLVAASADGSTRAALAWFAVHGTALGADWPTFSADVWGSARTTAEAGSDNLSVGFGGGSSGDVSPLPLDENGLVRSDSSRPGEQGRELADWVGGRLGSVTRALIDAAEPVDFTLAVAHEHWKPRSSGLPVAHSGMATAGGGVDGQLDRWPDLRDGVGAPLYKRRRWRTRLLSSAHSPKVSIAAAYSPVPLPLGLAYRFLAPKTLPLHVLRIGSHAFATVPGEASSMVGWRIERDVIGAAEVESASIIGFSGDYSGYWVTPEEYLEQRYEGASMIFGRNASTALSERLHGLAVGLRS